MVHVSKLEMRGFKSFGHKKETLPLSPGLTAIVGPNGIGKSNIVDALSFVLGQRSAKTLRASDFSGLIYYGGEGENGKKPAPYAKVKLHITDDDGSLPIDSEKVSVSRKVNRDGKSTYKIDGKRTTRREILELLSGEMIGTEGYNFVMQGDVGKFIKMSSQERRKIIDDLAGVAEFEEKKARTLSELEEVETDLQSQEARLEELEQNMKKLEKDKEEALKFQELRGKLEGRKASLAQMEVNSCKEKLEELQDKIERREGELEKSKEEKEELRAKQKELKKKRKEYEELIQEKRDSESLTKVDKLNSRIDTLNERLKTSESDYEALSKKIEELRKEAEKTAKRREEKSPLIKIEKFSDEFQDLHRRFNELTEIIGSASKDSKKFEKSFSELRGLLENLSSVISKLNKHFERALKSKEDFLQLAEKTDKIEEAGSKFEQLKSKLASARDRQEDAKNRIDSLKEEIEEGKDSLREARDLAKKVREEIEETGEKKERLEERLSELEDKSDEIEKKIGGLKDEESDFRTKKASTETELEQAEENLEKYGAKKVEASKASRDELEKEAKKIERGIEKLRPINERAVEDYEGVKERYNSQKEQYDKLGGEKQKLLDLMEEIDREKTKVFMEVFEEVSENFSEIFSELSPGGIGKLALENPEEPLEGGLEIKAEPEGKKLENVASLSGGEKALTSLAFIFAIQRTKPSALYVLDEIDAHLDPENQKGVAEMVKRFAQKSQIIVVTIRDSMMSVADKLFGVDMDDKNISHLVSVDLEEFEG